jgi:TonB family protein
LRASLGILVVLSITAWIDVALAAPSGPAPLFEIDLANLPPGVTPPEAVNTHDVSAADYPVEAVAAQQTGMTILRYVVLEDGNVGPTELLSSSGYPSLDQAASVIVRRWRFSPATQNGRPIRVWQRANVVFNLGP